MQRGLLGLPTELIVNIVDHVEDTRSLRNLALASRLLQTLTEPTLYRTIFFRTPRQLKHLVAALEGDPIRRKSIRIIDARCQLNSSSLEFTKIRTLLCMATRLTDLTIESPCCNSNLWEYASADWWRTTMRSWLTPIIDATNVAKPLCLNSSQIKDCMKEYAPLQHLKRLTLHLNGEKREFWTCAHRYAAIFTHPTIEELHLSSINLPKGCTDHLSNEVKTPLKRLTLDEANITFDGLRGVLTLPKALEEIYIGENRYSPEEANFPVGEEYNYLLFRNPTEFLSILSRQEHSLKRLTYYPAVVGSVLHPFELPGPGFRSFNSLESITIASDPTNVKLLFLREMTAPPNLVSLHLHDLDRGPLEMSAVDQTNAWNDISKGLYLLPAVMKKLSHLIITSENSPAYGMSVESVTECGTFLQKKEIEFRCYRKKSTVRIVRPILYGETEDVDILVYKNDGREFTDAGDEGLETGTESSWEDETDEDNTWGEDSDNEEMGDE